MDKLPTLPPLPSEDDTLSCDVNLDDDECNENITGIATDDMLDKKITASKVFGKDFTKKKVIENKNEVISTDENNKVVENNDLNSQLIKPKVQENLELNTNDNVESEADEDKVIKRVRKKRVVSQKTLDALKKGREKGIETRRRKKLERLERERNLLLNDERDSIKEEIKEETDEENFNKFLENYSKMKEMKIKANKKKECQLEETIRYNVEERRRKENIEKQILLEQEKKKKEETINFLQPKETNPYASYFN